MLTLKIMGEIVTKDRGAEQGSEGSGKHRGAGELRV